VIIEELSALILMNYPLFWTCFRQGAFQDFAYALSINLQTCLRHFVFPRRFSFVMAIIQSWSAVGWW